MMIKLKDFRETIGAPPFCKHAGSRLLPNAPNIPNCGLVLKLARYRVSRALEASLHMWEEENFLKIAKSTLVRYSVGRKF